MAMQTITEDEMTKLAQQGLAAFANSALHGHGTLNPDFIRKGHKRYCAIGRSVSETIQAGL